MSAKERKRANNRKIRQYNRATGKTNSRERTPLQKTIYCLITLVVTGVILFGIVTFFTPSSINEKMDQLKKMDYPQGYSEFVTKYSKEYNVDENLVYAVIRTESHFENDSQSGAGAMGLMQITPDCFDFLKQNIPNDHTDYNTNSLYDPEINIKFGTYFLSYLLDRYDNIEKTSLAAYNAGFGIVDVWLSDPNCSKDGKNLDVILYPETANYVVKVEDAKNMYKELY